MARILPDGQIQFDDGRALFAETLLNGKDFLELVPLLRQIDPALGHNALAGFPFSGGGGGQGPPGPAGPPGPPGGPPSNNVESAHSFYTEAVLTDTTPQIPSITYDGATVAQVPVTSGRLVITDAFFGFGFVFWSIQIDFGGGGGFVSVATFGFTLLTPLTTEVKKFKSPIVVPGGPGVAMRIRVAAATPPVNPLNVNCTLRLYSEA